MTIVVSEFSGIAVSGAGPSRVVQAAPQCPALAITQVSSGTSTATMSTIAFNTATQFVVIAASNPAGGSGGPDGFFFIGSSTAVAPSSTQMELVPGGAQSWRGVPNSGFGKMWVFSS